MKAVNYPSQLELHEKFELVNDVLHSKVSKRPVGYLHKGMNRILVKIGTKGCHYHRLLYIFIHGDIASDVIVDHIDRNPLNNTISNLRAVSKSDNNRNCTKPNTSGYAGVWWKPDHLKWYAGGTTKTGKQKFLGYFEDRLEAHKVVLKFKAEQFPQLNPS